MLPAKERTVLKFLVVSAVLLIVSVFLFGNQSIISGILSGVFVSLSSLFFLARGLKEFGSFTKERIGVYFLKGFILRLFIAGLLLYFFIAFVKTNISGLLLGLLAGLVINNITLIRLVKETKGS
jgi:hypothetical protein